MHSVSAIRFTMGRKKAKHGPGHDLGRVNTTLDALPDESLIQVFSHLGAPWKQVAAQVCKRWRDLMNDAAFVHTVLPDQSLSDAIHAAAPGDTIVCPSRMYQETLFIQKPLRLVAEGFWPRRQPGPARGSGQAADVGGVGVGASTSAAAAAAGDAAPVAPAALEPHDGGPIAITLRPPVVLMNCASCCFVGFEFHTAGSRAEVSICCYGPQAVSARFEHCTFSGQTGLKVPYSKGSDAKLVLVDCQLHGTRMGMAAVQVDTGLLHMERCCVHNNSVGVEVGPGAVAKLLGCELRFNNTALVVDGCLLMARCRLWANAKVGCLSTDKRLREAQQHTANLLSQGRSTSEMEAQMLGEVERAYEELGTAIRLVANDVVAPQVIIRSGPQKEIRKKVRHLVQEVYGPPDDEYPAWEILAHSDLDTSDDDDDSTISSVSSQDMSEEISSDDDDQGEDGSDDGDDDNPSNDDNSSDDDDDSDSDYDSAVDDGEEGMGSSADENGESDDDDDDDDNNDGGQRAAVDGAVLHVGAIMPAAGHGGAGVDDEVSSSSESLSDSGDGDDSSDDSDDEASSGNSDGRPDNGSDGEGPSPSESGSSSSDDGIGGPAGSAGRRRRRQQQAQPRRGRRPAQGRRAGGMAAGSSSDHGDDATSSD